MCIVSSVVKAIVAFILMASICQGRATAQGRHRPGQTGRAGTGTERRARAGSAQTGQTGRAETAWTGNGTGRRSAAAGAVSRSLIRTSEGQQRHLPALACAAR